MGFFRSRSPRSRTTGTPTGPRRATSPRRLLGLEPLEERRLLTTGVNLLYLDGASRSDEGFLATHNGSFYYVVNRDGQSELWQTDGSAAGAKRLATATSIHSLTSAGDDLVYVASNRYGSESLGFIHTTGYPPESVVFTDLTRIDNLTAAGGTLYFTADDGLDGLDLYRLDSPYSDATMVYDFQGSLTDSQKAAVVGEHLYFTVSTEFGAKSLWKSDGTEWGTELVMELGAAGGPRQAELTEVNGELFFHDYVARDVEGGYTIDARLWKSNPATGSLELVKTIPYASLSSLANVGGTLFFAAYGAGSDNDYSLWKSDGTEAGTVLVNQIDQERDFGGYGIGDFVDVGGVLYFTADDDVHGRRLWRSDGTAAGTYMLRDTYPNVSIAPSNLVNLNGVLYFTGISSQYGTALWTSDGTTAGTVPVTSIVDPTFVSVSGDRLFFTTDSGYGVRVWMSDGTAVGTEFIQETGIRSPGIASPVTFGQRLFFVPDDGWSGDSLWASDGSAQGTQLVKGNDLYGMDPSSEWSRVDNLFVFQDALYFTVNDGLQGDELWISDGTPDGTQMLADLEEGPRSAAPRDFTVIGGALYFTTHERTRLWRSDGTAEGTGELTTLEFGSRVTNLTNLDGTLFFLNTNEEYFAQTALWKSDGTAAGTVQVKPLYYPSGMYDSGLPGDFFAFGGALYFSAEDGTHGRELWRSDGTLEGTAMVKDINAGYGESAPRNFIAAGGDLYFTADDGVHGRELWTTDGTADGTHMVVEIRGQNWPGYESSDPSSMISIGGTLYFAASDGGFEGQLASSGEGIELWKSDGTPTGTAQVKDINPEEYDSTPRELTAVGDVFYFSAYNRQNGRYLWRSDGTTDGTSRFADDGNMIWGSPHDLVNSGGTLYFVSYGALWALPAEAAAEIVYHERSLVLNQERIGHIGDPATGERWVFAANAGDQVTFDLGQVLGAVRFRLKGPGGWIGFENQAADSGLLTLPHSGRYELEAYLAAGATGTYSFRLQQPFTELAVGETYQGTIPGTGFAQVFQVDVPFDGVLLTTLDTAENRDNIEIYLRRGAPPTRSLYDLRRERVGADHELFIPDVQSGTWYVLVYAAYAPLAGEFSLRLDNPPVVVDAITPPAEPNFEPTWVTISGAGFDEATTVEFVGTGSSVRTPTEIEYFSATSLRALLDLGTWTADDYRVVVRKDGYTDELATPFVVTEEPYRLETRLIVPDPVGFAIPIRQTIWIEYTNAGRIPMPAPLLKLTGDHGSRLTLDPAIKPQAGFGQIAGTSPSVEVLGLGSSDMPWLLMPGETGRIPVYYLGLTQQEYYPSVSFELGTLTAEDQRLIDWQAQEWRIRVPDFDDTRWNGYFESLRDWIGSSWGAYVARLGEAARAWYEIDGERIVDVRTLYALLRDELAYSTLEAAPMANPAALNMSVAQASSKPLEDLPFGINSPFGWRWYKRSYHAGLDVPYNPNTPLGAVYGGDDWRATYYDAPEGQMQWVILTDGKLSFHYGHVSDGTGTLYQMGNTKSPVMPGDLIALVGDSGSAGSFHLHLRADESIDKYQNPLKFLNGYAWQAAAPQPGPNGPGYGFENSVLMRLAVDAPTRDLDRAVVRLTGINGRAWQAGMYEWEFAVSGGKLDPFSEKLWWCGVNEQTGVPLRPGYSKVWALDKLITGLPSRDPMTGEVVESWTFTVTTSTIQAVSTSADFTYTRSNQMLLPPFPPGSGQSRQTVGSRDPNDLLGPGGYGPERFIRADSTLAYTIRFENLAEATAPAREVRITNPLDPDLDLDTLELTEIAFAGHTIAVPPGNNFYEASVPLTVNGTEIQVEVSAGVDYEARELFLTLQAIDPETGWFSEDPLVGLLYPEDGTGRGQGSVSYLVRAETGLPSGTLVENQATITFDYNDPIDTPLVRNTLDAGVPTSSIQTLPLSFASFNFDVTWAGQDEPGGSGIAGYDIYVSDNGGDWTPWLLNTQDTQATFYGQHEHTYRFYSIATDNVGHRESAPAAPDTKTTIEFSTDPRVTQIEVLPEFAPHRAVIDVLFSEDMDVLPLIADGSILQVVGLFDSADTIVTLQADQITYNIGGRRLRLAVPNLAEGEYELRLAGDQLLDASGSPLRGGTPAAPGEPGGLFTYAFLFNLPPVVTVSAPALTSDTTPPVTIAASDTNGLPDGTTAWLDVDLNGDGDFADPGERGHSSAALVGGTVMFNAQPLLLDGPYRVRGRVVDTDGGEGMSDTATIVVDTTPPVVTLLAPIYTASDAPSVTVWTADVNGVTDGMLVNLDVDLDNNGDFLGPGERNYTSVPNDHSITVFAISPPLAKGRYGLRARAADRVGNEGTSATSSMGVQIDLDFGDAPDPLYPTLLASDGARHMIDPEVYLGAGIDAEAEGQQGATAGGDDSFASDDEDGVQFHTPLTPGQTASITVDASIEGVLDAWIDFNGNGVWEEGVERIFAGEALHQFSNSLNINVPADARLGDTYGRFRFSRAGIPTVTGTANDGEVEDYRVTITNPETYVSANPATRTITAIGRDYLDDDFRVTLGQTLLVILINGQPPHEFLRADYDTINFDGGDGRDTAEVYASDADNYGEMSYKSGWITDGNVRVNLADSEVLTLHGGAGYDEVKMFDSVFNDVWTAERLSATMDARLAPSDLEPIYLNSADGFERILAVANREGRDKAILNDSPDVDFVTMQPNDFAWMGLRSELYNEVAPILTYFIRAKDFEDIEANSTKGGADVVKFKDWNGADTMHAWPTHATMTNDTGSYSFLASGFDYVQSMVYKQRRLGLDTAYLYGMDDASDAFVANGDTRYTLMKQDDVYSIVAKYFGKVYADTGTGDDAVKILDDPGMGKELLEVKDSDSLGWDAGYRWLRYSNLDTSATLKFAYEVCKFETATARSSNVMDKSEIDAAVDAWMTILGTGGWKNR